MNPHSSLLLVLVILQAFTQGSLLAAFLWLVDSGSPVIALLPFLAFAWLTVKAWGLWSKWIGGGR